MTEQNYANHMYRPTFYILVLLIALVAFMMLVVTAVQQRTLASGALALLGFAVMCGLVIVRRFALRLQNRLIRLEMQVRLARLGRENAMARLTLPQIIALRFASDAELPALIDRATAENLSADQIKRAVTAWQADLLRT